jgi:hypothetical protein
MLQPSFRRLARRRPGKPGAGTKGSKPKKDTIRGMDSIGGSVCPFSQWRTLSGVVPNRSAACFWVRPSASLRARTCSPIRWGSDSKGCGFNALRLTGTNGKKATRPCPCGYHGDPRGRCRCTAEQVSRYRNRISGPLLDRIDLQIEVPAVPPEVLQQASDGEASALVRQRVSKARARQFARQGKANARLTSREIDAYCQPSPAAATLLKHAISCFDLSARGFHRALKVARTIADMSASDVIEPQHVAEAVQYRRFVKD